MKGVERQKEGQMAKISIDLILRGDGSRVAVGNPAKHWEAGRITDEFMAGIYRTCVLTLRKLGRAHKLVEVIQVRFLQNYMDQLDVMFKTVVSQPLYPEQKGEVKHVAKGVCPENKCPSCEELHVINAESVSDKLVGLIRLRVEALISQATASADKMKEFLPSQ